MEGSVHELRLQGALRHVTRQKRSVTQQHGPVSRGIGDVPGGSSPSLQDLPDWLWR
jgi:hypothetical protein